MQYQHKTPKDTLGSLGLEDDVVRQLTESEFLDEDTDPDESTEYDPLNDDEFVPNPPKQAFRAQREISIRICSVCGKKFDAIVGIPQNTCDRCLQEQGIKSPSSRTDTPAYPRVTIPARKPQQNQPPQKLSSYTESDITAMLNSIKK